MKRNNLPEILQSLKDVRASDGLRKRLHGEMSNLSPVAIGQTFALPAFRLALAGVLLLVVLGFGTGIVAAAKGSHPGSLLFPLKKAIIQTQISLTTDQEKKTALQKEVEETPTASPTAKPVIKIKEKDEEEEQEKEVEGVSTSTPLLRTAISPKEKEENEGDNRSGHITLPRHGDDDSSQSDN